MASAKGSGAFSFVKSFDPVKATGFVGGDELEKIGVVIAYQELDEGGFVPVAVHQAEGLVVPEDGCAGGVVEVEWEDEVKASGVAFPRVVSGVEVMVFSFQA